MLSELNVSHRSLQMEKLWIFFIESLNISSISFLCFSKVISIVVCLRVSWFVVDTINEYEDSVSLLTSDFESDFLISISLLSSSGVRHELSWTVIVTHRDHYLKNINKDHFF